MTTSYIPPTNMAERARLIRAVNVAIAGMNTGTVIDALTSIIAMLLAKIPELSSDDLDLWAEFSARDIAELAHHFRKEKPLQ